MPLVDRPKFYWPWLKSWLFYVNFVFFQWFFVRLCQVLNRSGGKTIRWEFLRWVVPLTGWWSVYKYWPRKITERKRNKVSIDDKLDLILYRLDTLNRRNLNMAKDLDQLIADLNANTNLVASRLDALIAQIAADGSAPTQAQLDSLQAISDHLKALGADNANPVPTAPTEVNTAGGPNAEVPPSTNDRPSPDVDPDKDLPATEEPTGPV